MVDYRSKKRNFYERNQWKIYKDYETVPPIVSEELWEKANTKLLSRSKSAKMYQKHQTKYPLSGKLYCNKHKCSFVRKVRHYKNKIDEVYWYCSNFHKTGKKSCDPSCFKEQDLYNILLSIFKTYEIDKEEICEELIFFYNSSSKLEENNNRKINLQNELKALEKRQEKLLDLALEGFICKEDLRLRKVAIEKQIEQINLKLKELESKKEEKKEKQYNESLKEYILKELNISNDNLENYIEELLDKIIIIEENSNITLKITLAEEKNINYNYLKFKENKKIN